jgi:hypothetical protein
MDDFDDEPGGLYRVFFHFVDHFLISNAYRPPFWMVIIQRTSIFENLEDPYPRDSRVDPEAAFHAASTTQNSGGTFSHILFFESDSRFYNSFS